MISRSAWGRGALVTAAVLLLERVPAPPSPRVAGRDPAPRTTRTRTADEGAAPGVPGSAAPFLGSADPAGTVVALLAEFRGQRTVRCALPAVSVRGRVLRVVPGPARGPDDLPLAGGHAEIAPRLTVFGGPVGRVTVAAEPEDADLVVDLVGAGAWRLSAPEGGDAACTAVTPVAAEVGVRGWVVDADGLPVPGAALTFPGPRLATSDEAGAFELGLLPLRQRVSVRVGEARGWATVEPAAGEPLVVLYGPGLPAVVVAGETSAARAESLGELAAFVDGLDDVQRELEAMPRPADPALEAELGAARATLDAARASAATVP